MIMIAEAGPAAQYVSAFVDRFLLAIGFPIVILLLTVALVVFLYGCFEYVLNASNDEKRAEGQRHILFGLIGMLVMISAYAILRIGAATFGIETPDPGSSFRPTASEQADFGSVNVPGLNSR